VKIRQYATLPGQVKLPGLSSYSVSLKAEVEVWIEINCFDSMCDRLIAHQPFAGDRGFGFRGNMNNLSPP
jgi:hypothetical protein